MATAGYALAAAIANVLEVEGLPKFRPIPLLLLFIQVSKCFPYHCARLMARCQPNDAVRIRCREMRCSSRSDRATVPSSP